MTPTFSVRDLLEALGRLAPWEKAAEWDRVGLQVGDPDAAVTRIAVCHEVTDPVVAALEADRVDLLVTYHPLLFRPLTRLVAGPGVGGRAVRLVRAGISLACVHTSFDGAPGGAADALANALDLSDVEGFAPVRGVASAKVVTFLPEADADRVLDAVVGAGAGRIGNYTHCSFRAPGSGTFFAGEGTAPAVGRPGSLNREPEVRLEFGAPADRIDEVISALVGAHPYEEPAYDVYDRRGEAGLVGRIGRLSSPVSLPLLRDRVATTLAAPGTRLAGDPDRCVSRIAVVPGSGSDFIPAASALGAEALVTGDVSHHRAREALDRGLAVLDAGHVATERPGCLRLESRLREFGVEVVSLISLDPEPWIDPLARTGG